MLDPFTALSLASGVVQFVDFSSKLISEGQELYKSAEGALTENTELKSVTVDLNHLCEKLVVDPQPQSGKHGTQRSKDDAALE